MHDKQHKYVSVDPGAGPTRKGMTGWAIFDEDGNCLEYGQAKESEFNAVFDKLLHSNVVTCIVEDYRNHPWMKQKGFGRNETSKLIGKLEMLCELRGIPLALQPNTVKPVGYMWAGLKKAPSNHAISHQYDAVAHGVYWLQSNGVRKPGQGMPKNGN